MFKLKDEKALTENLNIQTARLPDKVYIPLSQHIGKICQSVVKPQDAVKTGQLIAALSEKGVYAPVHSSLSGKVAAIGDWPHPTLGRSKAIIIESDALDEKMDFKLKAGSQIECLSPNDIRKIVFDAGIVGMGGASFPTHIKLSPPKPVDTLIINGAECEPYSTGDYRLMIEKTENILEGIKLIERCLGAKKVHIAIEDNKPEAIERFKSAIRNMTEGSPRRAQESPRTPYAIRVLESKYPQGGEKQLIKNLLNQEIPRGKLPFDIGVVVQNVATCFAVYEAVYLNKPLYERVVTVSGSCLSNPKNLLARIGTPIKELIDSCGPLKEEPAKIIIGGPMMGIAQFSDEVPVIKSTTAVLLFNKKESRTFEESFCIRCGACIRECPVNLMPCLINLASEKGLWDKAKEYGAADCIECGLCSYVCSANRTLVQSIKRAKLEVQK